MRWRQVDRHVTHRSANAAGDVEVEAFFGNSLHADALGIAVLFFSKLISLNDFVDVLFRELVLAFAFYEVLGGVDEKHVIVLFALFEHEDTDRDASGVEEIRG